MTHIRVSGNLTVLGGPISVQASEFDYAALKPTNGRITVGSARFEVEPYSDVIVANWHVRGEEILNTGVHETRTWSGGEIGSWIEQALKYRRLHRVREFLNGYALTRRVARWFGVMLTKPALNRVMVHGCVVEGTELP